MISYDAPMYNICYLGKDNNGIYYKYFGRACTSTLTPTPTTNAPEGFEPINTNTTVLVHWGSISNVFAQGFGKISWARYHFEYAGSMCMTSAVKNNVEYFNPWTIAPNDVGIGENTRQELILFPNPANELLQLPVEYGVVKLFDPFGKLVKQEKLENKNSLDISEFTNGVYMIEIQADSFKFSQKLIIQH